MHTAPRSSIHGFVSGVQSRAALQLGADARSIGDGRVRVDVALRDGDGQAVKARAQLIRPTHAEYNSRVDFTDLGGGRHGNRIALKLLDQYELHELVDHSGRTYQATRRVVLKPDG